MRADRIRAATGGLVVAVCGALLLGGCAGAAAGAPAVVTVTDTISRPPVTQQPAPVKPDGSDGATPTDRADAAGAADRTASTSVVGRPTIPDPESPGAVPGAGQGPRRSVSTSSQRPATRTTDGGAAQPSTGSAGTPPGSLSTDGNLIAAATSAAAAAGVRPANPDTPGPATGPACPADKKYVNEAPTGLRSDVVTAWTAAVAAARAKGIMLCLNDGKRSRAQQQAQFDDYADRYGEQVAEELVLPPEKSAHVVGIAVDAQPAGAYRWLQATDGSLGFCRIYDNEPWHFEFNPAYRRTGCPDRLPEPER